MSPASPATAIRDLDTVRFRAALPRARVFPGRKIAPLRPGCKGLGGAGEAGGGERRESGGGAAYGAPPNDAYKQSTKVGPRSPSVAETARHFGSS